MAVLQILFMKRNFRRGDRVTVHVDQYDGASGTMNSVVFQRTYDQPNDFCHGYHLVLDCGTVITVSKFQME